jgi:hypothetical protein
MARDESGLEAEVADGAYEGRIRSRKSYQTFRNMLDFLETNPTHEEILYKVCELMDEYRAFRSAQASGYARESIGLLVRERGIPSGERT